MADQPHNDESHDNVGTGAEISTENDITASLHDGPDGAPQSAPAVALESPSAAHDYRSSTLFPRRDDNSLNAAAAAAPTVAGAEAGAIIEREIYQHELAQSVEENEQQWLPPTQRHRGAKEPSSSSMDSLQRNDDLPFSEEDVEAGLRGPALDVIAVGGAPSLPEEDLSAGQRGSSATGGLAALTMCLCACGVCGGAVMFWVWGFGVFPFSFLSSTLV